MIFVPLAGAPAAVAPAALLADGARRRGHALARARAATPDRRAPPCASDRRPQRRRPAATTTTTTTTTDDDNRRPERGKRASRAALLHDSTQHSVSETTEDADLFVPHAPPRRRASATTTSKGQSTHAPRTRARSTRGAQTTFAVSRCVWPVRGARARALERRESGATTRQVHFPFEAYDVQKIYMEKVIESLQEVRCGACVARRRAVASSFEFGARTVASARTPCSRVRPALAKRCGAALHGVARRLCLRSAAGAPDARPPRSLLAASLAWANSQRAPHSNLQQPSSSSVVVVRRRPSSSSLRDANARGARPLYLDAQATTPLDPVRSARAPRVAPRIARRLALVATADA